MTTEHAGAGPAPMVPARTSGLARRLIPVGVGAAVLGLLIILISPASVLGSVVLTLGAALLSWTLLHDALDGRIAEVVRWALLVLVGVLAILMLVRLLILPGMIA